MRGARAGRLAATPAVLLLTAVAAVTAVAPAVHADERWTVQGLFDFEYWDTDPGSRLLSRNDGDRAVHGRLQLWAAADPHARVRLVAVGEAQAGEAGDAEGLELQQAYARFRLSGTRNLLLDVGRFSTGLGNYSQRYLSTANPLVGEPDTYSVAYPDGVRLLGAVGRFDFRIGVVDRPLVVERYVPEPGDAWRPTLAVGVTPATGLRIGIYATAGPYLGETVEPFVPQGERWRDFEQEVAGLDVRWSRGYFELNADLALSTYEVPTHDGTFDGTVWYVEPKYTWTPRFFTALRFEENDYVFIEPRAPVWRANTILFRDVEVGLGYRFGPDTLLKASYRVDRWDVDGFLATILPDGHAFALQVAHAFDVRETLRRPR